MFEKLSLTLASVRVRTGHQNITWRRSITVAEIKVIERFELAQAPTVGFPGFDDFFQKLHFFLHFEYVNHLKGLVLGNYIQVEKAQDFYKIQISFRVKNFLQVLENKLFVLD